MARCFVIGPIGNKFASIGSPERDMYEDALDVFDKVIFPACLENSLEPVRADRIAMAGDITEQVFRHLYDDDVVIADVSGGNPNVMYELGLRHTRDSLTIQIGEFGQLPFDVSAVRTIKFSRSERGLIDARKELTQALAVGLSEGADPVTATRVWMGSGRALPVDTMEESSSLPSTTEVESVAPDGLLERMQTVEEVFPKLGNTAETIGQLILTLGTDAEEAGRELEALSSTGAPTSARVVAVGRFAKTLEAPADELTRIVRSYVEQMSEIDGAVNGILEYLSSHLEVVQDDRVAFLESLVGLAGSSREATEGLGQFVDLLTGLGSLSRALRRPSGKMAHAIKEMATATAVMDEWESTARDILRRANGTAGVDSPASRDAGTPGPSA